MLVNGGARIMINLNPDIFFDIVTSKWLVKIFVGTMIWSTSSCVYHRKVLILRIVIAKCLVKGCTGHDHPALTYPCPPLTRYFIRATLIINPVKLSIAMINNLFSLGMGWTKLLIIEEYLIRFAISASRPCPQMACAPISWRRKLISNLTSASHRNPARQKPARTIRSLHKLYQALLHKSIQHHWAPACQR